MTFDYAHQTDWPMTSGQHQSPIDIQTQHVQSSQLSAINWRGLYQAKTITGEATNLKACGIGADYLNDRDFAFQQIHFHPHQSNGISFIKVLPASSPSSPFLDGLASLILVYKAYLTSSQPKRAMN